MNTLLLLFIYQVLSQSCLNHQGDEVEWWVMLNMKIDNGQGYLYCDSESCNQLIYKEGRQIQDEDSPLSQAMREIAKSFSSSSTMNIIWSDKQPFEDQDQHQKAHSKGMLQASWEKQYGFIISHSLSQFPFIDNEANELKFGDNAGSKAEHFFCATLDIQDIEEMAELYSLAQINTYKYNEVDEQFKNDYPNIYDLRQTNKVLDSNSSPNRTIVVQTDGHSNLDVIVFAINSKYEKNIYEFIMGKLKIGLITEQGVKRMVEPVKEQGHILGFNQQIYYDKNNKIINFNSNEDHSKYAISDTKDKPYICFSDLGVQSRKPKGGTALCFEHYNLWNDIRRSFVEIQKEDKPFKKRNRKEVTPNPNQKRKADELDSDELDSDELETSQDKKFKRQKS